MYANTPEAVEFREATTREAIEQHVGCCREWIEAKANVCGETAEYVLWGKLIPAEGLGPRCYVHAAEHVGHRALYSMSNYALINIGDLTHAIDRAHFPNAPEVAR